MKDYSKYGIMTKATHAGQGVDEDTGAIRRSIIMANSFKLPDDLSQLDWSGSVGNVYTRNGAPNERWLEEKVKVLHEAEDCVVLASGVAALHALFFTVLKSGDHAIISDNCYAAVYRQFTELFPDKFGIEGTLVDTSDPQNIKDAVRPNTKLVHIETPGNPSLKITDIQAAADIAHEAGAILTVDNTFASPIDQLPLKYGADVVVESLTKYINGSGDSLGGAVVGPKELLDKLRYEAQVNVGGVISPFAAWLILRGAATLPLRMKYVNDSSQKIAEWLEGYPGTRFVWYPGLPSTPNHEVAKKQMTGYGGVISFGIKGTVQQHFDFVAKLKLITSAVSLGHDETLILYLSPEDERNYLYPEPHKEGFYRFAIGLEDTEDIIEDLRQAFEQVGL